MPNGGQISAGSGLRLQVSSPGVQDNGSFNINGTGIAGQFTTNPGGTAPGGPGMEIFGHGHTIAQTFFQVCMGNANTIGQYQDQVAVGYSCSCLANFGVALGINCNVGGLGINTSNQVAIGVSCSAGDVNPTAAQSVAMGYNCAARGGRNVAIGSSVSVPTANNTVNECVGVGSQIMIGMGTMQESAVFGYGVSIVTNLANVLVVGVYNTSGVSGAFPGVVSNQILIGNAQQSIVKIGPYIIGQSVGQTATYADTSPTLTFATGTALYTSITAARTVTLPLANTCQVGFRILIADMSGQAGAVNTITATRQGADTINGGTSAAAINTAYGVRELITDGVSKWTVTR